jgi:ABC-type antimicrobial peptide transport system permease subunit
LKAKLFEIPEIKSFSFSNSGAASPSLWTSNFKYNTDKNIVEERTQVKMADVNYFKTYGILVIAGRGLLENDTITEFVVNQSFVKAMGLGDNYQDAIGKVIRLYGLDAPVVGVVKDFNSQTLHEKVTPLIISSRTDSYMQAGIKINAGNYKQAIEKIKKAWLTAYPDYVFDSAFLDDTIKMFYEREERTSVILNSFSFIAILISCLGLFGLAAYSINAKTKEIGIRKVLGASLTNILTLITKDFFKLIIAGFAIAVPAAYYLMNIWLNDFAYRITIGPGVFIIAVAATSIIALATVGYMSLKAATANPVKSLKYE